MSHNPVILSYDESLLRKSDVDLLSGPFWLNDNIISFYFEYLKNLFKEAPFLLFVSPEVTQCIKITPNSQMSIFLDPLDARTKEFIFFALNDNDRPQSVGGTHWSLLLFSRSEETMFHYDSARGSNNQHAANFAKKVFSYFQIQGQFKEEVSHQQDNGYDCGIYLICNAEHLGGHLARYKALKGYCNVSEEVKHRVGNMRKEVANVIKKLSE